MSSKIKYTFLLIIFIFFNFPKEVKALSLSISNLSPTINFNQEVEVDLLFSCSGCGDISYMRGVFFPSGTNYFGFTQNKDGNWIGTDNNRSLYYSISKDELIEASWSGKIKVKPDSSDSAFLGTGEYLFKIGRYTSSTDSSADWSNELPVKIIGPTPSPTPAPTSAPTTAPTASPAPTSTPSQKPSATKTSVATIAAKETDIPEIIIEPTSQTKLIDAKVEFETPRGKVAGVSTENKSRVLAFAFFISGALFLGYGGYMLYNMNRKNDH